MTHPEVRLPWKGQSLFVPILIGRTLAIGQALQPEGPVITARLEGDGSILVLLIADTGSATATTTTTTTATATKAATAGETAAATTPAAARGV